MPSPLDSALDAQGLADEQRGLLDLTDKLQFAQLDNVKLPQIVVVGDQSAGKSSFATEIRLRRSPESSTTVSIIPDKNRSFRDQERLREFGGLVDVSMSFEALMRAAVDLIAPKNIPGHSRTIILAVVGGNSDCVEAPILTKARHFGPNGSRSIGVLTKPDLTESIGLEDKFIELVKNKDKRNDFGLGWYGQPWPSVEERQQYEKEFFSRGKWSSLPDSICGASALKQKLSTQLQRHIGKHVNTLQRQIQQALDECETELKSLGSGKDTPGEMRVELVEMFSASKELVIPAVCGFYKNPPKKNFFRVTADPKGTPSQNLRARATEENDRFALKIRAQGRKLNFQASNFVRQEVDMLLRQIRGSEFPTDSKPRAVYMLFQSYSENWPKLAQEHKDNLGVVCNEFLGELIDYAWPPRMREPLRHHFLDPQIKALMEKAQRELDLLTEDMNLEVQPYDPEYEERLRSWQANATKDGARFSEAEEVLEKMLIYYELSAKGFIRNVITQVVERHLLQGMYSIFNSVEILSMSDEVVEAIAAENKETRDRRQALKIQKKAIEEAKDICASLAMRKELRMYAADERENVEDTSEDEGSIPAERRPASGKLPELEPHSTPARGPRRRSGEEAQQITPGANEVLANGSHGGQVPSSPATIVTTAAGPEYAVNDAPRVEAPRAPDYAVYGADGLYTTESRPLQQAPPPPPPRPEKVRAEEKRLSQGPNPSYRDPASTPPRYAPPSSQEPALEHYYAANGYTSSNPYAPDPRRSLSSNIDPGEYSSQSGPRRTTRNGRA
ncbi:hypothetical protein B0T22DRAFT_496837 [Podospora appendiculata]|uniref:GED domain-containing protein n=1 Tax=Podospora appendiculata TaxID=314037 RepID=A0AAE0XJH6_9PEZI|nr:hypothetical protein B0T22DRAFT_496837 [Podospora appendiculata]